MYISVTQVTEAIQTLKATKMTSMLPVYSSFVLTAMQCHYAVPVGFFLLLSNIVPQEISTGKSVHYSNSNRLTLSTVLGGREHYT